MASHCHPHHHHNHCLNPPPPTFCTCCFNPHPSPPPPPPPPEHHHHLTPDQLLQALAFLLHQQPQSHPHPKTPAFLRQDPQDHHHHHLVSSLAQRISDLESALGRFPPPPSRAGGGAYSRRCVSLREAAARVIQTRFRAFLVRRSRALGQLQELAFLKASFVSLNSSVSGRTQFDSEVVSRKALDLLLRVDSIEGCDSMIRDGKRSITRDLVRFLDFVDGFTLRRRVEKSRAVGVRYRNGNLGGNQRGNAEELRIRAERIRGFSRDCGDEENDVELEGFQQFIDHGVVDGRRVAPLTRKVILDKNNGVRPRSTKSVRFSENGNVYWVINDEREPVSSANIRYADGSDDHGEEAVDTIEESRVMTRGKEDDDEAQSESEGSSQGSDGDRIPKGGLRGSSSNGSNRFFHDQDGDLVFSAPVSANIGQRADLPKKRQGVKIMG